MIVRDSAGTSPFGKVTPHGPTASGNPPPLEAITAQPQAIPSRATTPNGSL